VVGKTNLHEIAFGTTSNNAWFGPVHNPYDFSRICGGSSGGTAAGIVSGMVTIGLGTDTGGSGRIPAALCGCVGFRPTTGRYPADGVMLLTTTRDTISLMARSVADVVLADEVIAGPANEASLHAARLRLGLLMPFSDNGLSRDVRIALDSALNQLREAGVEIVPVDGGELYRLDQEIGLPLVIAETYPIWRDYAAKTLGIDFADFANRLASPDVRAIFQNIATGIGRVPDDVYIRIREGALPRLRRAYAELFVSSNVDAFVFPTVMTTAPPIGNDAEILIGNDSLPLFPTLIRNVGPGSLGGLPGITLPISPMETQLPVGLALDGPVGSDSRLLAVATVVEEILQYDPPPLQAIYGSSG
jgi:mandelamide amidase